MMDKGYIHYKKIFTYDIISSPGFSSATMGSPRNIIRKLKIDNLIVIKKPLFEKKNVDFCLD